MKTGGGRGFSCFSQPSTNGSHAMVENEVSCVKVCSEIDAEGMGLRVCSATPKSSSSKTGHHRFNSCMASSKKKKWLSFGNGQNVAIKMFVKGGFDEGRKGVVAIDVEMFEVTPAFHLVEIKKFNDDTLEHQKLLKESIRPALQDIVWTLQLLL
ncbi:CBL-interacting serine/threonine-protein kinase 10 [Canna indica]|uniref:CBL-interacting serine/threonine-protein kinase 10 n=1 Tax=Canna indica TaxID=4628 RepID=A0AAQ3KFK5_9LILI|nr:CBL-interacting serine/threonine-protein kinase 10 [Canna indica]